MVDVKIVENMNNDKVNPLILAKYEMVIKPIISNDICNKYKQSSTLIIKIFDGR